MREIFTRHAFSITFLAILFVFVFFFTGDSGEISRFDGQTMGTTYSLQLVDVPDALSHADLENAIFELLQHLDMEVFSTYSANSELSNLNQHPVGVPFIGSRDLIEVLSLAQEIAELSAGAFDVTVGPAVNLWGFGPDRRAGLIPSEDEINRVLERIGYQHLMLNIPGSEIIKTRDLYIDLSAIAKGYAVDRLVELVTDHGIDSYFIEIGGELAIGGLKSENESWVPAIEAPVDGAVQIYDIFYNRGEEISVAGSGDYRNFFEQDGSRYSHEIDPRTARPVAHQLAAVYVISDSAARADAMATAYMILGLEQGRELASRFDQAVYFIYASGNTEFSEYITPQFEDYMASE